MTGPRPSGPSTALYLALAVAAVILAALPLSSGLRQRFLASHHLRPPSLGSWLVVGVLPKMYGGRHEVWLSPEPLTDYLRADPSRAPFEVVHLWVNHSPSRFIRLDTARAAASAHVAPTHIYLESAYGQLTLTTTYWVRGEAGRLIVTAAP